MHFAYNEKRKSATLSFAGRYSIVDMVNTVDDIISLMSAKVQIAMEGSIGEQMKRRILRGEWIFVVDRKSKTLKISKKAYGRFHEIPRLRKPSLQAP